MEGFVGLASDYKSIADFLEYRLSPHIPNVVFVFFVVHVVAFLGKKEIDSFLGFW